MALAGVLALTGAACALGYANDPQFQNWLAQAEARCTPRYGALLPLRASFRRTTVFFVRSVPHGEYFGRPAPPPPTCRTQACPARKSEPARRPATPLRLCDGLKGAPFLYFYTPDFINAQKKAKTVYKPY